MKICEVCGNQYETRSKRFCSRNCMWKARPSVLPKPIEAICVSCGEVRIVRLASGRKAAPNCSSCASDKHSGSGSPVWKGGHKHWSPGRYGKDKDNLSWCVQRKLAWERDNYECQHCHEKKSRKPDVHHIEPWMNSNSHALENLICLCQSCHLKEEAKVHEVWGGQLVSKPERTENKISRIPCSCGATKLQLLGIRKLCWKCWLPIVQEMKKTKTIPELAKELEITYSTVNFILHSNSWKRKKEKSQKVVLFQFRHFQQPNLEGEIPHRRSLAELH